MLLQNSRLAWAAALSSLLLLSACKISIPGVDIELDLGTSPELYSPNPDPAYTQTKYPIFLITGRRKNSLNVHFQLRSPSW